MKVHEVNLGQPLAKACNPTSVILLPLSRFSVVSPGQLLAKGYTFLLFLPFCNLLLVLAS